MPDTHLHTIQQNDYAVHQPAAFRLRVFRKISQFAMVALLGQWSFYGIFRCPFLVPYISCQNCPVITCHGRILSMFWGFWLLLPITTLAFGRVFCGWACPGGLISQLLSRTAPFKLRIRNAFNQLMPYGKYAGLAVALYCFYFLGQPRVDIPIRVGEFFQAVALTFEHADPIWLIRTFFILGLVAASLVVANVWCRYACPAGGLLELISRRSFFKFYKTEACNDCNLCLKVCEMGTRPDEENCTNCGDCLSACPANAISFGRKKSS